jgi:molecular chaperone DnaJ
MTKDHYLTLGVNSEASPEEIKAAFRRRAMESHPDRSGQEGQGFIEVQEAYGVLADPERRREYDHQRLGGERRRLRRTDAEPLAPRRAKAETFGGSRGGDRIRGAGYDDGQWVLVDPTIEVVIDRRAAWFGGRARVWIPAQTLCSSCGGRGAGGGYVCGGCEGNGVLLSEFPLEIAFPPGVREGDAARIVFGHGVRGNVHVTVLFRVAEW